jgi:site-specific recombinase XerD
MIGKNFSVLFFQRKPKDYVSGNMPIYMRITVDGQAREMTTSRNCHPASWDQRTEKVIGKNELAKELNNHLSTLRVKVYEARLKLITNDKTVTAASIKDLLAGNNEKSKLILGVFKRHNDQVKELLGSTYAPATLTKFRTAMDHATRFIKWKYRTDDIDVTKLDYEFITAYEFWLKSMLKCNHNTSMKYIRMLRKIVNECLRQGWLTRDPFFGFKMSVQEVKITPLTHQELKALSEKRFSVERLNHVRDIFLFCCYTGLAYADVHKLKKSEISIGVDGEKWIFTHRQKTESSSRIPLLPQSISILEKYGNHIQCLNQDRVLPVLSNQKMNAYLKEIADLCGINKNLTFHIARHTFATTVTLSNGVPIETVSKMLGHKNLRTTQHYAKILDKKVSEDMQQLKKKLLTAK